MSERDDLPDPIDKIYAQAEALLDDQDARAARRARILATVAEESAQASPFPSPVSHRSAWRRGGWLAAASVAGVGLLLATQIYRPAPLYRPSAEVSPPAHPAPSPTVASAVTPPPQAPKVPSRSHGAATREGPFAARDVEPAPAPWTATAPAPGSARAEPPVPPANENVEELVVTGSRIENPSRAVTPRGLPAHAAESLRDAAAAGRTRAVAALLAQGVPVDAPDGEGETALMKAVQKGHPEVVALLRRHGANLEGRNHAGRSAKDMAASLADPQLNRALGLDP